MRTFETLFNFYSIIRLYAFYHRVAYSMEQPNTKPCMHGGTLTVNAKRARTRANLLFEVEMSGN